MAPKRTIVVDKDYFIPNLAQKASINHIRLLRRLGLHESSYWLGQRLPDWWRIHYGLHREIVVIKLSPGKTATVQYKHNETINYPRA